MHIVHLQFVEKKGAK